MGSKHSKEFNDEPEPTTGEEWKAWYKFNFSTSEIERFQKRLDHIGRTLDENQRLNRTQNRLNDKYLHAKAEKEDINAAFINFRMNSKLEYRESTKKIGEKSVKISELSASNADLKDKIVSDKRQTAAALSVCKDDLEQIRRESQGKSLQIASILATNTNLKAEIETGREKAWSREKLISEKEEINAAFKDYQNNSETRYRESATKIGQQSLTISELSASNADLKDKIVADNKQTAAEFLVCKRKADKLLNESFEKSLQIAAVLEKNAGLKAKIETDQEKFRESTKISGEKSLKISELSASNADLKDKIVQCVHSQKIELL